jgi:altronate hydrolase
MSTHDFDQYLLRLRDADNVAVAKSPIPAGWEISRPDGSHAFLTRHDIAAGHKIALEDIADGDPILKYGQIIGFAKGTVSAGDHVHCHNVDGRNFGRDYQYCTDVRQVEYASADQIRTFHGYARPNGRVGTRNYVAVISSVNCSATVSRYVADRFSGPDFKNDYPGVDGIIALTHKGGCAMLMDVNYRQLQRVLGGVARHPNIGAYVLIGLGCEVNQVQFLVKNQNLQDLRPGELAPVVMTIQGQGGARKTVEAGVEAVQKVLPKVNEMRRTVQPVSKLVLAENCGGSEGNSGITANPALGVASDEMVRQGGTSVLAETTEIYGAEHLLTRRAVNREVGEKLVSLIHWWEKHVQQHGATIDNNPSFGNKAGGLTTIYEKSLGALAKGGQSPLAAVYNYAEPIDSPGLCFMDTPGFDPVSMTGLVAGGCNIGVFTTGRGSVYGCKPAPCIKVATNTVLYQHMEEDMDLNAGTILDGTETVDEVGQRIFSKIVAVAGGEKTKSEISGMGDNEFVPWDLGPTL